MSVRTFLVRLMAASPLLLAGVAAMPAGAANADTGCPTWNGNQPVSPGRPGNALIQDIAAVSPCDVWAVGASADAGTFDGGTLVEHWTGDSWNTVASPHPGNGGSLTAMSAASATDIWAVGVYGQADGIDRNLIVHFDGSAWSQVPSPDPDTNGNRLFAVDAVSANDAWAVGATGPGVNDYEPLVLHWDGSAWKPFQAPSLDGDLVSVSATSDGDVWAIENLPDPSMMHWNGSSWTRYPIPGGASTELDSVAALSPNNAWAVGGYVTADRVYQTLVERWDGTSWTQMASPNPGGTTTSQSLDSISAASPSDIWVAGAIVPTTSIFGPRTPIVMHWDGGSWTGVAALDAPGLGTPNLPEAVSVSDTGEAWVAGISGSDLGTPFAAPVPVVPHVNGDLVGESFAALATFGLRGGHVTQTTDCPASSSGLIIGSDPVPGQIEPLGTAVNVTQCVTPATVTVPNVLSWDDTSAQNAIRAAGLAVGTISWDNRCLAERGAVLVQSPNGDTQATPGSAVNLTESSGRTPQNKPCGGTQK
jgi:PASTA domain